MLTSSRRVAASSLQALRRKITVETLANLQPLLLLQMVMGVSQTLNSRVSRSRTLARTLLLSGQQRLNDLLASAPRLHIPVDRLLEFCRTDNTEHTAEEAAAQALIELCVGLMLQWMAERARRYRAPVTLCKQRLISPLYFLPNNSLRPPRARSCPNMPLA